MRPSAGGFDHAELDAWLRGDRNRSDGDFRFLAHVKIDHAGHVHPVDVVAAEDGHHVRVGLLDQVDVLVDGVGRALVPGSSAERIWAGTGVMK